MNKGGGGGGGGNSEYRDGRERNIGTVCVGGRGSGI